MAAVLGCRRGHQLTCVPGRSRRLDNCRSSASKAQAMLPPSRRMRRRSMPDSAASTRTRRPPASPSWPPVPSVRSSLGRAAPNAPVETMIRTRADVLTPGGNSSASAPVTDSPRAAATAISFPRDQIPCHCLARPARCLPGGQSARGAARRDGGRRQPGRRHALPAHDGWCHGRDGRYGARVFPRCRCEVGLSLRIRTRRSGL